MHPVETFIAPQAPRAATTSAPVRLLLTLADLERWFSTAAAGSTVAYFRGFLALDRGAGSRLGEDVGEELDHVAATMMAMAEAGKVHLVQRRHSPFDYTYLAVMARGARPRRVA